MVFFIYMYRSFIFFFSFFFFFFKQKTAYEIVSGDWSSDVCSSDLFSTQACQSSSARGTGVCACAARGSAFAASTTRVTTASRLMKPPSSFEPPGKRRRNPSGRATQQGHEGHGPERLALDPRLAPREANQLLLALGADRHDEPPPDPQLPDESLRHRKRRGRHQDAVGSHRAAEGRGAA